MAYTEVGAVNLALIRIGVATITALSDDTPQAIAANAVNEYIRKEVLEAHDWKFARLRVPLAKVPAYAVLNCGDEKVLYVQASFGEQDSATTIDVKIQSNTSDSLAVSIDSTYIILIKLANSTNTKNTAALIQTAVRALGTVNSVDVSAWTVTANTTYAASPPTIGISKAAVDIASAPASGFGYAYYLPSDFLRLAKNREFDQAVYPSGARTAGYVFSDGYIKYQQVRYSFSIEAMYNERLILATDFDNSTDDLFLTYIRAVSDYTKFTAHFISAFAYRLAAELALTTTEGKEKFSAMMKLYDMALLRAEELNRSMEYVKDETGNNDWVEAGR
jgi:hypothetical protein